MHSHELLLHEQSVTGTPDRNAMEHVGARTSGTPNLWTLAFSRSRNEWHSTGAPTVKLSHGRCCRAEFQPGRIAPPFIGFWPHSH